MKKNWILFLLIPVFLISCKKGDSNDGDSNGTVEKISGTIANMPSGDNYQVKLVLDEDLILSSADVSSSGAFSIELPSTIADEHLFRIGDEDMEGVTISDENAQIGEAWFELYQNDNFIDWMTLAKYSITSTSMTLSTAEIVFSKSAVTMKGTYDDADIFDLDASVSVDVSWKSGWNWMVLTAGLTSSEEEPITASASMTSTLPSGMQWYVGDDLEDIESLRR